jgi:hypothetical protein
MEVKVRKGKVLLYRVFDIGSEIDLDQVERVLEQTKVRTRFKLDRKQTKSLFISMAPLDVQLGAIQIPFCDTEIQAELIVRVWHFGSISLCFQIPIEENIPWSELVKISSWIENDVLLDEVARQKALELQNEISSAIPVLNELNIHEDYVIYFIQEFEGLIGPLCKLADDVDIPALIIGENKEKLSEMIKKSVLESTYQYSVDDLVVLDWNSALVVEKNGSMDVPHVIEFAMNQLLEMRFYDDLLDQRLNTLYNSVVGKKKKLFSNKYSNLAEEAGQIYLEISEIIETVENSFKTVGDFYLATIFRASSKRFKFQDWQKSINEKLSNLAEISKLLHSEINESRNQVLEIVIIILIGIEVVPFVYNLIGN